MIQEGVSPKYGLCVVCRKENNFSHWSWAACFIGAGYHWNIAFLVVSYSFWHSFVLQALYPRFPFTINQIVSMVIIYFALFTPKCLDWAKYLYNHCTISGNVVRSNTLNSFIVSDLPWKYQHPNNFTCLMPFACNVRISFFLDTIITKLIRLIWTRSQVYFLCRHNTILVVRSRI